MRLYNKLMLAQLVGTVAVLGASAVIRVQREVHEFDLDMRRDGQLLCRTLGQAVSRIWQMGGQDAALAFLQTAVNARSHVVLRWTWLDGEDLPATRPRLGEALLLPLRRGEEVSQAVEDPGWLYTYVPVRAPSGRLGALELSESLTEARDYARVSVRNAAATTLALMLTSGLLLLALGQVLFSRPRILIMQKIRRVSAGDLSGPLVLAGDDEITDLAQALNRMCEDLLAAHERARSEASARLQAVEQLRHADRLMTVGKLASGVAHELGTPLNVVAGHAQMILEEGATLGEVRHSARVVSEQAQRMALIIRQLLDFARGRSLQRERADLREIAAMAVSMLGPMADKRGVRLTPPQGAARLEVMGDEVQLQQALTNVLVNAIQATAPGGLVEVGLGPVRATPPAEVSGGPGDYATLWVRDNGPGMSEETLQHIFEPFYTTKDVGVGTGLGLSVTYGILHDHGGWIEVQSAPGGGSTFTLLLPAVGRPAP